MWAPEKSDEFELSQQSEHQTPLVSLRQHTDTLTSRTFGSSALGQVIFLLYQGMDPSGQLCVLVLLDSSVSLSCWTAVGPGSIYLIKVVKWPHVFVLNVDIWGHHIHSQTHLEETNWWHHDSVCFFLWPLIVTNLWWSGLYLRLNKTLASHHLRVMHNSSRYFLHLDSTAAC